MKRSFPPPPRRSDGGSFFFSSPCRFASPHFSPLLYRGFRMILTFQPAFETLSLLSTSRIVSPPFFSLRDDFRGRPRDDGSFLPPLVPFPGRLENKGTFSFFFQEMFGKPTLCFSQSQVFSLWFVGRAEPLFFSWTPRLALPFLFSSWHRRQKRHGVMVFSPPPFFVH